MLIAAMLFVSLSLMGCSGDPSGRVSKDHEDQSSYEGRMPPQFSLGDKVTVRDSTSVGIIVDVDSTFYSHEGDESVETWMYDVMFQNQTIEYVESHLKMHEPMKWISEEGVYE